MSAARLTRSLAQSLSRRSTPPVSLKRFPLRCLCSPTSTGKEPQEDLLMQEKSWWKRKVLQLAGFHGKTSTNIRQANYMYDNCLTRTDDPKLIQSLGLGSEFVSRFELLSLHVWMCLVRLRIDGKEGSKLSQELFDNFWDDMMNEIRAKGVKELSVNKHLVELQERFFGLALAYDESIACTTTDPDAKMASALWRNLYSGEDRVSVQHLNSAVRYTRSQLQSLCKMPSSTFVEGDFQWDKVASHQFVLDREVEVEAKARERTPLTQAEFF